MRAAEHAHTDAVLGHAGRELLRPVGEQAAVVDVDVALDERAGQPAQRVGEPCCVGGEVVARAAGPLDARHRSLGDRGVQTRDGPRLATPEQTAQALGIRTPGHAHPRRGDAPELRRRAQHDDVLDVRADDARRPRVGDEVDVGLVDDERRQRVQAGGLDEVVGVQRDAGRVVRVGDDHERGAGERGVDVLDRRQLSTREAAAGERLEVVGVAGQRDGNRRVGDLPAQRPDELRRAAPGDELGRRHAEVTGVHRLDLLGRAVGVDLEILAP